ncbi:transposase [Polyangium sp. rjm3]|uniref:Transposase n=1 Tax=Polyangium mundeleinium TaxID=2995306 RepID=A0ABT5EM79_9BACT|nr:transposase [Polyangium mundeleinium]MDC0742943.1 transposase [Polyangium mundeleinium]
MTFAELEAQVIALEKQLSRVAHERGAYRKLYELCSIELERLRRHIFGQKAERVDPAQTQLALDAVVQSLGALPAQTEQPSATPDPAPAGDSTLPAGGKPKPKERKVTPHGRQNLPGHLPVVRFLLSRSMTKNRPSCGSMRAWHRDRLLWGTQMARSSARPMVSAASPMTKHLSSGSPGL